jgi:predicted nucleotidyltransferase
MLPEGYIQKQVKEAVIQIDPQAEVYLFGSQARGDGDKFSDWDVLVLSSKFVDEKSKELFRNSLLRVELATDQIITSVIYEKNKWSNYAVMPLFQNIAKDGLRL